MKKRIVLMLLAVMLILSALPMSVTAAEKTALPMSAGISALRNQFSSDTAPQKGGHALDYCYYSPAGENDGAKYPLVIFLHGIGHADYPGAQLDDSDMAYWASSELQSRFTEGGAYILLPRAPEHKLVYWSKSLIEPLRAVIDDMIDNHGENIDTSKIFIGGLSAGAEMTWDMIVAFPEYFAGAFPMAATGTVSADDVKTCKNVAIWMIASSKDPVISYVANIKPLWNNVVAHNARPSLCRFTTLGTVYNPDGSRPSGNHHMAKVVSFDMHMLDGSQYRDAETIDGNGKTVVLKSPVGMISWMNSLSSDYDGEDGSGSGNFNVSGITRFFDSIRAFFLKIVNMFQRLFGM